MTFIVAELLSSLCLYQFLIQAQFSQMRPVAMAPSVGPRMPMYPPGGPGIGQQIFYGQAPPAMIPPQVIPFSERSVNFFSYAVLLGHCNLLFQTIDVG